MNLYLNYFAKEENVADDNPPIGIVLGAYKDQILVEYATENITSQLFVSKYEIYLPNKKLLAQELEKLLDWLVKSEKRRGTSFRICPFLFLFAICVILVQSLVPIFEDKTGRFEYNDKLYFLEKSFWHGEK